MKTFYTSNYDRNGKNEAAVAISVPSLVPADYTGIRDANLAPSQELLDEYHDKHIDHDTYTAHYTALLDSRGITPQSIVCQFNEGTVFICFDYEDGDESICHRFILADWLNASGLASVKEV